MTKKPRDIGASVRARLLNHSRERAQPFDLLLTRYALERLLYRLSVSAHRDRFVLKGAPKRLEVSRVALSRVVNDRAAVSAELAIRLAAALGGSAES